MSEMRALITMLPSNAGSQEAEFKNLVRNANVHLEVFARSRLLFIRHQRVDLKEILDHHCEMVVSQLLLS